jgi:hypothetical protein
MSFHPRALQFHGAHFGLLSLHHKASIIAPLLAERWQARLTNSTAFDTDTLGTFSGEVERRLKPVECALHKARLALELTGADFGLGSEGSFGASPWGIGTHNQELVACVPAKGDWAVVGVYAAPFAADEYRYGETEAQQRFWQQLPAGQGVMAVASGHKAGRSVKGITTQAELEVQLAAHFVEQIPADLRITYDLRAHQSPQRRVHIARAAENLFARLACVCPDCARPGFWPDQTETGLPCAACGTPTHSLSARIAQCAGCGYQQRTAVAEALADPATCPWCNP